MTLPLSPQQGLIPPFGIQAALNELGDSDGGLPARMIRSKLCGLIPRKFQVIKGGLDLGMEADCIGMTASQHDPSTVNLE